MFAVDWTEPLLYDLVIDPEAISVMAAIEPGVRLIAGTDLDVGAAGGRVRLAGVIGSETVFRRPVR